MPKRISEETAAFIGEIGDALADFRDHPLHRGAEWQDTVRRLRVDSRRRGHPELVMLLAGLSDLAKRYTPEGKVTAVARLLHDYRERGGFGGSPQTHAFYARWRREATAMCELWRADGGDWDSQLTAQMAELAEALAEAESKAPVAA